MHCRRIFTYINRHSNARFIVPVCFIFFLQNVTDRGNSEKKMIHEDIMNFKYNMYLPKSMANKRVTPLMDVVVYFNVLLQYN